METETLRQFMWIARALLALLLISAAAELSARERYALLIGNTRYDSDFGNLTGPKNDVDALASLLREYEFKVSAYYDLTQRKMDNAVGAFVGLLNTGDTALFYYAGHAVQDDKEYNWLIPVRTHIALQEQLNSRAVNAQEILNAMEHATQGKRRSGITLMLLDACRDYPLPSQLASRSMGNRGLARMTASAQGTFISFAAAPGKRVPDAGRYGRSAYVNSLLSAIRQYSGETVEQMFKHVVAGVKTETGDVQQPWTRNSLTGDFCFHPKGCAKTVWRSVQNNPTQAKLQKFLTDYPNSDFAGTARWLLKGLPPEPVSTPPPVTLPIVTAPQAVYHTVQRGESLYSIPRVPLNLRHGKMKTCYHRSVTVTTNKENLRGCQHLRRC
ncbi:MAG: caspase family protein, partial [Gammaproteobacteria bacterium]|nr:caspase family protein [Gammaproteobacteria bacterium]